MKVSKLLSTVLMFGVILLTACDSEKDETIEIELQPTLAETLDKALDVNIAEDEPGMIVAVWQNGTLLYTGMKGLAREGMKINETTGFLLASVSKTFTAIATLQLYEQNLIQLEDSIVDYLPELSDTWRGITIHHLLSHQSGIPDFANDFQATKILPNGITNANIIRYFSMNPTLEFPPGTQADYSNTGYVLLAEVIAKVSGVPFSAYMQESVFNRLGMTDSYIYDENTQLRSDAALNMAKTEKVFGADFFATGTSNQVSSMQDMLVFTQALLNEQILQKNTMNLMLSRHAAIFDGYGYGTIFFNLTSNVYGHTGGKDGYRTMYAINKEKNAFVIMLGNGGDTMPDQPYITNLVSPFL